jgi:hypothetical protein
MYYAFFSPILVDMIFVRGLETESKFIHNFSPKAWLEETTSGT